VVAFLLIGVENIGVQIEQPFSVLPLELFCSIIKTNVMEMLAVSARCPHAPLASHASLSLPWNDSTRLEDGSSGAPDTCSFLLLLRARVSNLSRTDRWLWRLPIKRAG